MEVTLKSLRAKLKDIESSGNRSTRLTASSLGAEFGHMAFTLRAIRLCADTRRSLDLLCSELGLAIHSCEVRGSRYDWHYFYVLVPRAFMKDPDKFTFSTDKRFVRV